jgi:hypothetical protein
MGTDCSELLRILASGRVRLAKAEHLRDHHVTFLMALRWLEHCGFVEQTPDEGPDAWKATCACLDERFRRVRCQVTFNVIRDEDGNAWIEIVSAWRADRG